MSKQTIYTCDRCFKTGSGDDIYSDDIPFQDENVKVGGRIHLLWRENDYKDLCTECRESLLDSLEALLKTFFTKEQ